MTPPNKFRDRWCILLVT
uniref:Uncharacterized protein n=1 Tax=Arundo donax TaxID=35708 RepID=A0A0A9AI73_ARUDO